MSNRFFVLQCCLSPVRRVRRLPRAILVWALVLLLAGCGAGSGASPSGAVQAVTPVAEAVQADPTAEPAPASPTAPPTPVATATPTATPTPAQVRLAIIGDFGLAGPPAEEVANLVKSWNPDVIVTTGDNNYPNGAVETIDANIGQYYHEFIHPYRGTYGEGAATNRFFPILGNHDLDTANGQPYFDYFDLPGNERYYTATIEPVTLFALNSMPGEPDGITSDSAQAEWLRQALAASETCWNLVFYHHAAYTSGFRGPSEWMRWPFQEWGADATFSGHNHVYERVMQQNMPHFVNGLGGGSRYAFADTVAEGSAARYNADHGAMLVEAIGGNITFQFVTRTGEVIDSYNLEKACA